ncbi:hypothetical protein BP6252_04435 [Coleophoma cylindrospora]|uniref:Uncharacterized protein n=1 Tax=Coleophoma cylindrospora TaxID=1849047 RepID=A0A3D8S0G6_9HELO|nr:hypothetical protein BP6252_04435 [Coleophoma cylindrospora]
MESPPEPDIDRTAGTSSLSDADIDQAPDAATLAGQDQFALCIERAFESMDVPHFYQEKTDVDDTGDEATDSEETDDETSEESDGDTADEEIDDEETDYDETGDDETDADETYDERTVFDETMEELITEAINRASDASHLPEEDDFTLSIYRALERMNLTDSSEEDAVTDGEDIDEDLFRQFTNLDDLFAQDPLQATGMNSTGVAEDTDGEDIDEDLFSQFTNLDDLFAQEPLQATGMNSTGVAEDGPVAYWEDVEENFLNPSSNVYDWSAQEDLQETGMNLPSGDDEYQASLMTWAQHFEELSYQGAGYRSGVVIFVYDHYFDFRQFAMHYPGSKVLGFGQLHDWQWHINELGYPNIRNVMRTPLPFQNQDRDPALSQSIVDDMINSRPASTYGYVFEISPDTFNNLRTELGMTHQFCMQYVQLPIGDKDYRSACYVFYDARHTCDLRGVDILLDQNQNALWSEGFELMTLLDVPESFQHEVLMSLQGNPKYQLPCQDANERIIYGFEKLSNLHEYLKEVESRPNYLDPAVRPRKGYPHPQAAEQGQVYPETARRSDSADPQDIDDFEFAQNLPPEQAGHSESVQFTEEEDYYPFEFAQNLPPEQAGHSESVQFTEGEDYYPSESVQPLDHVNEKGKGKEVSTLVQPPVPSISPFLSSAQIAPFLPSLWAYRQIKDGGEELYEVNQNDQIWEETYAFSERSSQQPSHRQADDSLVLGAPKQSRSIAEVQFHNRERNEIDLVSTTSSPNTQKSTNKSSRKHHHNKEDTPSSSNCSTALEKSIPIRISLRLPRSSTHPQGPIRGSFSSSRVSEDTSTATPSESSENHLSPLQGPNRGFFSSSKAPEQSSVIAPSGYPRIILTLGKSSNSPSSQQGPKRGNASSSTTPKQTSTAGPSSSSKQHSPRLAFAKSPLRDPSRGYISPPTVPNSTSAIVARPSKLRYSVTMAGDSNSSGDTPDGSPQSSVTPGRDRSSPSPPVGAARSNVPATPKKGRRFSSGGGKSRNMTIEEVRKRAADNRPFSSPSSTESSTPSPEDASSSGMGRYSEVQPMASVDDATLGKMVKGLLNAPFIAGDADLGQRVRTLATVKSMIQDEPTPPSRDVSPDPPRIQPKDAIPSPEARAAFWQNADDAVAEQDKVFRETGKRGKISWTSKHGVIESGQGFVPSQDIVDLMKKLHGKFDDKSRAKAKECLERLKQQMADYKENKNASSSSAGGVSQPVVQHDEHQGSSRSSASMNPSGAGDLQSMTEHNRPGPLTEAQANEDKKIDAFVNELSNNMDEGSRAQFMGVVARAQELMKQGADSQASSSSSTSMDPAAADNNTFAGQLSRAVEHDSAVTPSPQNSRRQPSTRSMSSASTSGTRRASSRFNTQLDTPCKPRQPRNQSGRGKQ